jgi:ribonucleoside-diphosphate reductase alpha chain
VPRALEKLGYGRPEIESILAHNDREDTIEGAADLRPEHLPVFDCAFTPAGGTRSIPWRAHITMMAAAQPFLSGAISKTVNMPADVTPSDVADAYMWGWKLGLKALAIYRDGSKQSQPLNTKSENDKAAEKDAKVALKPKRERLPDTRQSVTHKFNVGGHEGYLNVGMFPDGRPGELFITMAKEGSTVGGLMDAFGTAISISLQYGVPLEALVNKFSHMRFEPMGHTPNPDIRIAKSVIDYIFRWMGIQFMPGYREQNSNLAKLPAESKSAGDEETAISPAATKAVGATSGQGPTSAAAAPATPVNRIANLVAPPAPKVIEVDQNTAPTSNLRDSQFATFQMDAPSCDNCGSITVRNGNCYLCHNCGNSMGCS